MTPSKIRILWVGVAMALCSSSALARPILMAFDGKSDSNALRAFQLGHTVTGSTLANMNTMTQQQLGQYQTIFVSPDLSLQSYGALRTAVADGGSLQHYVATGGTLVLNVAGRIGSQHDIAPGGVDYVGGIFANAETIGASTHPLITGVGYNGNLLSATDFAMWLHTDHGYIDPASLAALNAPISIVSNQSGPSVVEYQYGQGRVLITTLTVGWAMGGQARGDVQENVINYEVAPEPASLALLGIASLLVLRRRHAA